MDKEASQLERDHIHSVYEKIAPCFNDACYKAWPKVQQFISEQERGSLIADIGCGNGKYLHISSQVYKLGCDYCFPTVESARSEGHEVTVCHSLCLPYRSECFDAVLSIAVIHHFSTEERCMRAIKETARILRVGGQIMIYVWAMEQNRRRFEKQDVFVPWNPSPPSCSSGEPCPRGVQKSILHKDKELALNQPCHKLDGTSEKELAVRRQLKIDHHPKQGAFCQPQNERRPGSSLQRAVSERTPTTQSRQQTWLRYHHVFKEGELAELIDCHIPELYITQSYFDHANRCMIAEKTEMWKI
ncbi:probable tRNA methyltransferase 9B [Aquila chrysaetos chrysaetos]|uniref:probable tRNA methyltransferase 9B n=1 Tax=Aquila chrysaetos chrysaetos TaxID=223781 RepID=UPI001176EF8B|nr:probable tRNA methyltransferase 9B [Aquila chrysaetos chrysaetos]